MFFLGAFIGVAACMVGFTLEADSLRSENSRLRAELERAGEVERFSDPVRTSDEHPIAAAIFPDESKPAEAGEPVDSIPPPGPAIRQPLAKAVDPPANIEFGRHNSREIVSPFSTRRHTSNAAFEAQRDRVRAILRGLIGSHEWIEESWFQNEKYDEAVERIESSRWVNSARAQTAFTTEHRRNPKPGELELNEPELPPDDGTLSDRVSVMIQYFIGDFRETLRVDCDDTPEGILVVKTARFY
jgi:hypothetical protein